MTLSRRTAIALGALLVLSLCLNLFVAGLVVARMGGPGRGADAAMARQERFFRSLPEEAQPVVREVFREHRPEISARFARLREARREVATLLRAETLDRGALDAAMAEVRARGAEAQEVLHAAMAEAAARLPPEARHAMAARWKRH